MVDGGDANLRRERAFLDALSPTGIADQQRMAAGDFRDALAKRLDYRIDHGAASDLAAFFGGHDVHLPDVPGGLQRAARLDAEKMCSEIVRGVARRAGRGPRALEPTDVAYALATSLAPMPQVMKTPKAMPRISSVEP